MATKTVMERANYILPLSLTRLASDGATGRREYGVTHIKAGYVRRRDGRQSDWRIPFSTLQAAAPLYANKAVFIDHASLANLFYPSMRDLAAVTFNPRLNEVNESIDGAIRLYNRPDLQWLGAFLDEFIEDQEAGREVPDVGLSSVFFGVHEMHAVDPTDQDSEQERVTVAINHVESSDIVFGPGAEGRLRETLSLLGLLDSSHHFINFRSQAEQARQSSGGDIMLNCSKCGQPIKEGQTHTCPTDGAVTNTPVTTSAAPPAQTTTASTSPPQQTSAAPAVAPAPAPPVPTGQQNIEAILAMLQQQSANIDRLTHALAGREEPTVVEGMSIAPRDQAPRFQAMWSNGDQIMLAYEQLMGLPVNEPVHRLSGIRELYILLTGDRNMRGEFNRDYALPVRLAYSSSGNNADTATMAELTRNVMNKVLVQQSDLLSEYQWWRRIVRIANMNSLQQVSWVRYGGIGFDTGTGLPTVAEKDEYQQLLWEDARTTADWVKKGGYLPLSLEMIDRDDLMAWRDVPRQLAVAQAVTISSVISALYTDNAGAGPALGDGVGDGNAFNTTRGNLITQPLTWTNWNLAVNQMYKLAQLKNATQTEDRRIAFRPRYAMVPIEQEEQAVTELTSAVLPGATNAQPTSTKRRLPEDAVITVPHWTNADNWAAVADPNLIPYAGVAFRFGEVPEIFAPAETNHILWLHDVMPIKTRWFFAISVIDTRGAIKSNVS